MEPPPQDIPVLLPSSLLDNSIGCHIFSLGPLNRKRYHTFPIPLQYCCLPKYSLDTFTILTTSCPSPSSTHFRRSGRKQACCAFSTITRTTQGCFRIFQNSRQFKLPPVSLCFLFFSNYLPRIPRANFLIPTSLSNRRAHATSRVAVMDVNITSFTSPLANANFGGNVPPQVEFFLGALKGVTFWTGLWTLLALAVVYDQCA